MTGSAKAKGDRAEREAAKLLSQLLGHNVRRLLGAGRHDDHGDLDTPGWAIQVADWQNLASAMKQKPLDADTQGHRTGTYGIALLRLRGGDYRVVMTPETWAAIALDLETATGRPTRRRT